METAAKIHTSSSKSVVNTASGGRSLPAVPVLQQKSKEQEEIPLQKMLNPTSPSHPRFSAPPATVPPPDNNKSFVAFALQKKEAETMLFQLPARFNPVQAKTNNTGLPNNLKSGIENMSGFSMDDIKVHYNSDKPAQLQAFAYARGNEIHIALGQEKHLPHEAWHVVQQKQGRVKSTLQMKGDLPVNDDKYLEREADIMGAKALTPVQRKQDNQLLSSHQQQSRIVQCVFIPGGPAPSMEDLLSMRFTEILRSNQVNPTDLNLLQAIQDSLTKYAESIPQPLVTIIDCAKYGIREAIENGFLDCIDGLMMFVSTALKSVELHIPGDLSVRDIETSILDQVKKSFHDAIKDVTKENTLKKNIDVKNLTRTIIIFFTNDPTRPPKNAQQIFSLALEKGWNEKPINDFQDFLQFKKIVLEQKLIEVKLEYFDQLPGKKSDKIAIFHETNLFAAKRFESWESNELNSNYHEMALVRNSLDQVDIPQRMNLNDLPGSYASVKTEAAHQHLSSHQNKNFEELSKKQQLTLSHLLRQMPVVKKILEPNHRSLDTIHPEPTWQNPAIILDNKGNPMSSKERNKVESSDHQIQIRIKAAFVKINNLVDRQILGRSRTPSVAIHKDLNKLQVIKRFDFEQFWGFRSFARYAEKEVHVGLNETIEILVHELGHLVEANLLTKELLDIQRLLHMRHENAPGGKELSHVYDKGIAKAVPILFPDMAKGEPAFKGDMLATSRYSAKIYDDGSTEVMSITLEHFSNPKKALHLIEKDPLQAAIILRIIQPVEFKQYVLVNHREIEQWLP